MNEPNEKQTAVESAARALLASLDALEKQSLIPLQSRIADRQAATIHLRHALEELDEEGAATPKLSIFTQMANA